MNIFFCAQKIKIFIWNINFAAQYPAPSSQLPGATAPFATPLDRPLVTAIINQKQIVKVVFMSMLPRPPVVHAALL
jgi:hypothetical protein